MSQRGSARGKSGPRAPQKRESIGWTLGEAAERLGVAPATLRTWDRRFGLRPSVGSEAEPRYDEQDLARLEVMRRLTLDGVAPFDAARTALSTDPAAEDASSENFAEVSDAVAVAGTAENDEVAQAKSAGADSARPPLTAVDPDSDLAVDSAESEQPTAAAESQGSTRPMLRAIPGGDRGFSRAKPQSQDVKNSTRVVAIIDAALGYDQAGCNQLLRLAPGESPVDWWTKVVEPAWARIAERTVLGTPGEAPELVLASAALGALREFTREYELSQVAIGNPPVNHPSRMRKLVLIFAPIDEDIPLAAHALAAALVSQGATARVVTGPASPRRAVELVTMVRPAALVLATALARPDLGIVAAVHEEYPALPLLVSMQRDDGLPDLPLAPSVQRVRSFAALVHEVLAIVE